MQKPAPPGVSKATSEEDILIHGKKVHVHGALAKNAAHPPQHAPQTLNYAAVAREEIHEVASHPPHVSLSPRGSTGVEMWDRVNSSKGSHHLADDLKDLLVGPHKTSERATDP